LAAQTGVLSPGCGRGDLLADQQFRRLQPFQFVEQHRLALHLGDGEATATQIQLGQTVDVLDLMQRYQQVIAAFVQQGFVGQGTGGDDPHHLPFHRPLAGCGIAQLLADGHRQPQLDQLGQVAVHRVERDASHRNRCTGRLAAGGQGDIEQLGGALGVVVEQFVEIAHPVEQQNTGMLGLDAQILLHHRGVIGQVGSGFWRWIPIHKIKF